METVIVLRNQAGVLVTQGSGLKKQMPMHPVSLKRVLRLGFLTCSKSKKESFNYDLLKVSKNDYFNYDLFRVSKMTVLIMTCSKLAKQLF